ncbi:sugar phosphate isomerase/epimerase [archaeon]|nr:sugar phosphate isomerase/epimerase [archaeon]
MDNDFLPTDDKLKEIVQTGEYGIGIDEFGTTTNPMQNQVEALKARIFHGASRVEFAFFGRGKGNKESATPETYGKRERADLKGLAEINEVETTTHASVGIQGLSGFKHQQFVFDEHSRKESVDEVKRAIHFAADATTGGAVVFHTGESPRSLVSRKWDDKDAQFELHPEEGEEELHYLVDPVDKKIFSQIKENERIAIPIVKVDENGEEMYLQDEAGNNIIDDITNKPIPIYDYDLKTGNIDTKITTFKEFRLLEEEKLKEEGISLDSNQRQKIIKKFAEFQTMRDVNYFLGQSKEFETHYYQGLEAREKIIKSLKFYKKLRGQVDDSEWQKFQEYGHENRHAALEFIPKDVIDPIKYLENQLRENTRTIGYGREVALSGRRQARETLERLERGMLAETYAADKAGESMGELGMYAWQKYEGNKKDLKNPIYIAPENLFPETYGSHPDELKDLILKGREDMQKRLKSNYGKSDAEAKKLAEKHIKATFDIGHVNVWRKYFKGKEGESLEKRDKRFNDWVLKKTKKMFDDGIIGHVHISDNYGFHDEHLTAGDGNAPIREFVAQAKKSGFNEFIVESGSFNPNISLPDTWSHFGLGMFGAGGGYSVDIPGFVPNSFADVRHGYFGRAGPPRHMLGEYANISKDFVGEPFYSGLGLE